MDEVDPAVKVAGDRLDDLLAILDAEHDDPDRAVERIRASLAGLDRDEVEMLLLVALTVIDKMPDEMAAIRY